MMRFYFHKNIVLCDYYIYMSVVVLFKESFITFLRVFKLKVDILHWCCSTLLTYISNHQCIPPLYYQWSLWQLLEEEEEEEEDDDDVQEW